MKCICCREDPSPGDKKKMSLIPDRTCQYCGREFLYPCRLTQHMKTKNKCSNSVPTVNESVPTVNNNVLAVNDSVLSQIQCSDSEKNTVPIRLSLS